MLLLAVGVVAVALLTVAVVTDASVLFLHRRAVMSAADGAALAGAQGVDLAEVYAGHADGSLPLDPRAVRDRVRAYLARGGPGLTLLVARTDGTRVRVRLAERVRLPFGGLLAGAAGGVEVVAEAVAESPLR